jgi:Cys-rich repeat protein
MSSSRLVVCALGLWIAGCGGGAPPGGGDMAGGGGGDMTMGCKDDRTCSGNTPHCDTKTGKCVGCLSDDQCGEGTVCTGGACVPGCNAMKPCGDAGVCDVTSGTCKSCQ